MAQRQAAKSDEWYTPASAVKVLLPYLEPHSNIWCPFDTEQSEYVKVLTAAGHSVTYTHIAMGGDFFLLNVPETTDYIISNPPYSLKDAVLEKLVETGKPFAMLLNVAGIFDSKRRFELLTANPVEMLYIYPRVKFISPETSSKSSPTYQSAYVCRGILPKQLMAVKSEEAA